MVGNKRNIIVGITILTALLALAWMIIQFGGSIAKPFAPAAITITFTTHRADGVVEGSSVLYRGVNVGKVIAVQLLDDNENVDIETSVNLLPKLPANVEGVIRQTNVFGGGASIALELTAPTPQGTLASGAKLPARFAGSGLIPPEIADLAKDLTATSKQLRDSNVIPNLNAQVTKVGTLVEELTKFVSDKDTKENLRQSLANIRTATDSATRVAANLEAFSGKLQEVGKTGSEAVVEARELIKTANVRVDEIGKQVNARMLQIAQLLETTQSITAKIDKGDGTAGRLVNDPRLYAGLVATTESLNLTIRDLQRLVQQWEQEGVSLKLK